MSTSVLLVELAMTIEGVSAVAREKMQQKEKSSALSGNTVLPFVMGYMLIFGRNIYKTLNIIRCLLII